MNKLPRIVITGVGLTAPNGNSLAEFRANLLAGKANIREIDVRYMGKHPAGICDFDAKKYQSRRELRTSTRAGSIAIYCAHEAVADSKIDWETVNKARVGVYPSSLSLLGFGSDRRLAAHSLSKTSTSLRMTIGGLCGG